MRLAVVAVLALAITTPANAKTLTIKVTSVSTFYKPTDRAPKGTSKGDTIEYRDRLVNAAAQFGKKTGAPVGSDHGTMTFTGPHTARFVGLAALPGGTVTLNGQVVALPNNSFAIPVTGGTGKYSGAKGYVVVGPGKKQALNTYALNLPEIPVA
jgi:hypothetical protein